jgi:hypothetical protein
MKISKIALAVLAVVGGQSAFALTANNYSNTGEFSGTTLNIRISGASAQDNGILGSALSLCTVGSLHRYEISNNFVYFCTPDVGTGAGQITVPAGITQLAIYKFSAGGSYFGVGPVNSNIAATGNSLTATGNQLPFLDLTKLNTSCGTATTTTPTFNTGTNARTYTNIKCGGASSALTTLVTTYIGLSDLEPAFFSNATSNLTAEAVYALIFGVPVTKNIRNALQTQQSLTSGSELAADQPSLTSAQVVTAYTQPGQTWGGMGVTSGLADDAIYIARRVDSSGTQKTFEALFARTPNGQGGLKSCAVGTTLFAAPDSGVVGTNTGDNESVCNTVVSGTQTVVMSGSGGGNVRNCLTNHNTAGRGAIGILTTEDKYDGSAAGDYRFVKIDGIAPNQANAAAGKYRGYAESFLNVRTSGAFATSAAPGYSAVVTRLKTDLANPAIIKLINGADQAFGASGLMALLSKQTAGTAPDFTGASSVIPWTKTAGTSVDNCQAPQLFN